MADHQENTVRTTLAVTLLILISKAGGFIREMIMAYYFGTGLQNDAYVAAYGLFNIPVLLFSSCITSTLIPMYVEARHSKGVRTANRFASNVMNLFAVFALVLGVLGVALASPLVHLVYPGFEPEKIQLTAHLSRIMFPSLIFFVVAIVMASILNARARYLAAQLTGFPLSVALIVAAVACSEQFGIQAVAAGVVAAGVLQVLILLPALSKVFRYTAHLNLNDQRFKRLMVLAVPAMLSMAVNEINHMIDRSLASGLPTGDLSAMNFAYKLITFVLGVLIVPLTTIMFSRMSERAAVNDTKGIVAIVRQCIEVVSLVVLPIMAIAMILSDDVIRFVYMRGEFNEQSVAVTSLAFTFYVVGVLGFGLRDLLNRAFHSQQDTKTPMIIAVITVVLNVILNVILVRVMGVGGLALATSISGSVGAVMLLIMLRKKVGRMHMLETVEQLLCIAIAAVLCAIACLVVSRLLPQPTSFLTTFGKLVLCTLAGGGVYAVTVWLLKVKQINLLMGMIKGGLHRH